VVAQPLARRNGPMSVPDLKRLLAEHLKIDSARLHGELTIEELGLDSLVLTEFFAALQEATGKLLDLQHIGRQITPPMPVDALLELVAEAIAHSGRLAGNQS
jgi:acyl carrier protein